MWKIANISIATVDILVYIVDILIATISHIFGLYKNNNSEWFCLIVFILKSTIKFNHINSCIQFIILWRKSHQNLRGIFFSSSVSLPDYLTSRKTGIWLSQASCREQPHACHIHLKAIPKLITSPMTWREGGKLG